MAERLQLLGTIDGQRVAHVPISNRSLRIHAYETLRPLSLYRGQRAWRAAAVEDHDRPAVARADPARRRRVARGGSSNARVTASAFSSPVTRKRTQSAFASIGGVIVTRVTHGSRPGSAAIASRSRSCRPGACGKSDAVWPSGPDAEDIQAQPHAARAPRRTRRRPLPGRARRGCGARPRAARSSAVEQRALRHRVVRALVVGRHAALVAPPQLDAAPVRLQPRRGLVRELGLLPPESAMCPPLARRLGEQLARAARRGLGVVEDDQVDAHARAFCVSVPRRGGCLRSGLRRGRARRWRRRRRPASPSGCCTKARSTSPASASRRLENPLEVTPDTLFQIGSITKTFTGTAGDAPRRARRARPRRAGAHVPARAEAERRRRRRARDDAPPAHAHGRLDRRLLRRPRLGRRRARAHVRVARRRCRS